ncbi:MULTISPECIES: replication-associated recombination protein A [unclassified Actinomyces]|uniref:replication-associated recombination protein A n=1 Tax=unclassified Actinomyces TaxID=2609248 RepID=UPI000D5914F6|nr:MULTISPECIES: replication-associated recombination protein A [unclassified Actinomyces]RAX23328.1 replication-associated recombination protein A [Actinomyces sp. Z3]
MTDLFESAGTDAVGLPGDAHAPLAVRMRPRTLDEVVGQDHLLAPGSPLRRLVEPAADAGGPAGGAGVSSVILWGPPGTGKTTLAYLVARGSGRRFVELSAVTAGVKDVRQVVTDARRRLAAGEETVLFVDEVHRFSRSQQDALLPSVENRWVTLMAATTENPSFSVVSPLLSRSLLLTLHPLDADCVRALVERALVDARGLGGAVTLADDAREQIVRMAGSDARKALTVLEAAAGAVLAATPAPTDGSGGEAAAQSAAPRIGLADVERAADVAAVRYDRQGDQHYDVISAFIKSMRGSDPDATLHYLARMLAAGEDPRYIARRITIHAAEDVGLADPGVLSTAVAAQQAVALIGMPEAQLVLAEAALAVATAPKSNAVTVGIGEATADVRAGRGGQVPAHLRDAHYAGAERLGHGVGYRYPHDYPHGVVAQQYLPDELAGAEYYRPTTNGFEEQLTRRLAAIRRITHGAAGEKGR